MPINTLECEIPVVISKSYHETVVWSRVVQDSSGFFLQVPEGWSGREVMVDMDGDLEEFWAVDGRVANKRLRPYVGKELEVLVIQHEEKNSGELATSPL